MKKGILVIGILQGFDAMLTLNQGIGNEANPFVIQSGFLVFLVAKLVSLGLLMVAYKLCEWKNLPKAKRVLKVGIIVMTIFLLLGSGWNLLNI